MKNDFLEQVGTADEKYIEEVLEYRSKKITVSKKKLIAIALAAALGITFSITAFATEYYQDMWIYGVPIIPDPHYREETYLDDGYAHINLSNSQMFAVGNNLVVKIRDSDDNTFKLHVGDTYKFHAEVDLKAKGIHNPTGVFLLFGTIVGDEQDEITRWYPDDDVEGVLEHTFTVTKEGEFEFYIKSGSLSLIHFKTLNIEKIS